MKFQRAITILLILILGIVIPSCKNEDSDPSTRELVNSTINEIQKYKYIRSEGVYYGNAESYNAAVSAASEVVDTVQNSMIGYEAEYELQSYLIALKQPLVKIKKAYNWLNEEGKKIARPDLF